MKPAILFCIIQTESRSNGGLQSVTEIMCRLREHRPIVLTNRQGQFSDEWRRRGIEVHVHPEAASAGLVSAPMGYAKSYFGYHRRLRALIVTNGVRVVHANDPLALQLSMSAAKLSGAKIVLNLRDTLAPGRRAPRRKFSFLFAAADHVFYLSSDMAKRWRDVAPNAMRSYTVTYSIVDPERFPFSQIDRARPPAVLVSGVFWPKKGQLDFIRHVVPRLYEQGIEVWFTGDFDPRDAYAAQCAAAAQPFGNVRFLGYRTDLPMLIEQARAVAVPSTHEGLMRGMIEAMACGRPVVSFDVCSARELLEKESGGAGVVVSGGDFDAMTDAIVRYCTDAEGASVSGEKGHAAASRLFAPDEVVRRYEDVYETLGSRP
jgi:glycosyltransferase involved in cell wall biosynthesis